MKSIKQNIEKIKQLIFICILILTVSFASTQKNKITVIFLFNISNFLFKFFDTGSMTLISISIGLLSNTFSPTMALQSFGQPIIWQIMCFLFLSQVLIKSGIARKISIYIMYFFGYSTLTLSFGFCFLTVFFALLIPTSPARIGGIFIPILTSIFQILSKEDQKLKDTIIKVIIYSNSISCAMFFTASSSNFYIQELTKSVNISISILSWLLNGIVPGLICLALTTLLIHEMIKPKTNNLKKINKKIEEEMIMFDGFSIKEVMVIVMFITVFSLWSIAQKLGIPFLAILFSAISILLVFELLDFEKDIVQHNEAWNLFFWMSNLLFISSLIQQHGSFGFLQSIFKEVLVLVPSTLILSCILLFYGYSQYLFASSTVHAGALYLICLDLCTSYGYPSLSSALLLAFVNNLFSGLTTYSASEVILLTKTFNTNLKDFNKHGFIITSFIFIIWHLCGMMWWKITGVI